MRLDSFWRCECLVSVTGFARDKNETSLRAVLSRRPRSMIPRRILKPLAALQRKCPAPKAKRALKTTHQHHNRCQRDASGIDVNNKPEHAASRRPPSPAAGLGPGIGGAAQRCHGGRPAAGRRAAARTAAEVVSIAGKLFCSEGSAFVATPRRAALSRREASSDRLAQLFADHKFTPFGRPDIQNNSCQPET